MRSTKDDIEEDIEEQSTDSQDVGSGDTQGAWEWGGCSDNVHYGAEFTKRFIDSVENPATPEGLVNLRNNEAGRRVS